MDIKTDQISSLLKKQLEKYNNDIDVSEVGEIIEVGDGIARIYGLDNVQAGEMVAVSYTHLTLPTNREV